MRRLLFSVGWWAAACLLARSSPTAGKQADAAPQIPFGQTYKDFQFPIWQKGQLAYTLTAASATGVSLNRADASDVRIDVYTNDKVTTTITSPRADLYVSDRKMRSKSTVHVVRADMDATSQICDFDLISKKYVLRQNVHVLLKNFDVGGSPTAKGAAGTTAVKGAPTAKGSPSVPEADQPIPPEPQSPPEPTSAPTGEPVLDFPGASATTNAAPHSPDSAHP